MLSLTDVPLFAFMQVNVPVEVDAETAATLQHTRFSPDFIIQMTDKPDPSLSATQQVKHMADLSSKYFITSGGQGQHVPKMLLLYKMLL